MAYTGNRTNRLTTAERAAWGAVGAAIARSRHDPRDLTAPARVVSHWTRFVDQVREEFPDLADEAEITRRALEKRKAWYARLNALSLRARAKKKAASVRKSETAQEVSSASSTTPTP